MNLSDTFMKYFEELEDPRVDNHNKRHNFQDILVLTILGTICGADSWVEINEFGWSKFEWLKTFLELPNGIPSHDTFGRVFSLIDSDEFEECFVSWIKSLSIDVEKQVISIDGKTLRGAHNRKKGKNPLHLVSAWCGKYRMMLGQVRTEEKSNEIEAIPRLLDMINVKGSIVTIDAMGCQKKIAKHIVKHEADYVLSLKKNQEELHRDVEEIFRKGREGKQYKKMLNRVVVEKVRAHGRLERRRYTLISAREVTEFELRFPGMKSIGMVEVKRTVNNQTEHSVRYFVSSLFYENIIEFKEAVRKHWDIEINLHWSLDVSFKDDLNRCRIGNSSENLAIIRRLALNLIKQDKICKGGISCRRKRAGWDHKYLINILASDIQVSEAKKTLKIPLV